MMVQKCTPYESTLWRGEDPRTGKLITGHTKVRKSKKISLLDGKEVRTGTITAFTGFHDRTGRPIFDGDRVKTPDGIGHVEWTSVDGGVWYVGFGNEGIVLPLSETELI